MTVTEDVDMGRQVIVNEDDHAQAVSAKYSDHFDLITHHVGFSRALFVGY